MFIASHFPMHYMYFSLSRQQRHRRHTMKRHVEEDGRGPASAQKHLRDLARSLPPSATTSRKGEEGEESLPALGGSGGEEGGLLEFQDVTDYGNRYMQKWKTVLAQHSGYCVWIHFVVYTLYIPHQESKDIRDFLCGVVLSAVLYILSLGMGALEMNRCLHLQNTRTMRNY